jgi:CelD/BcsL family acetyltransferase involved in cellulose biosynthesis
MRIDVVAPLDLTPEDVAAWSAIQAARPEFRSPFLSPHWARACARVDGPDRRSGVVAILRDDDGTARGFMPARRGKAAAMPLGAPMADYQAVIAPVDQPIRPRHFVEALGVGRLDFNNFLAASPWFAPFVRGQGESQVVSLSEGYEAYAAQRKAEGHDILKDCAKKRRKLEREHGPVTFTALSTAESHFEQLIAWKRAQYRLTRQTDIFDAGWPLELVRGIARDRNPEFGGALFTLEAAGQLIAAHFALRFGPVLHCWFIAHSDEFARYSPGVVLIADMLQWADKNGVDELDMGPGDYRFKLQLANVKRPVMHGYVGRASAASLVREAQYKVREAAEALPLGRASALPGKAMRRLDLLRGLR